MSENNEKHNMDIQLLRSDIATLHSKLDNNCEVYLDRFNRIETQTIKTNGRVTALEKIIWTIVGGGGVVVLLPTLQAIINQLNK